MAGIMHVNLEKILHAFDYSKLKQKQERLVALRLKVRSMFSSIAVLILSDRQTTNTN